MKKFETFTGMVAALNRADVDTDQIIPKQFLKRVERTGYGQFLFYDWRFDDALNPRPEFELNQPRYQGARILLTGPNFGCGSSREHAPWALQDYGFGVIIAPSFADIFRTNCFSNGVLPIELDDATVAQWHKRVTANEGYAITVDLENQTLLGSDGFFVEFAIDPFRRHCLLAGLDDIGVSLEHEREIAAYERRNNQPWQAAVTPLGAE